MKALSAGGGGSQPRQDDKGPTQPCRWWGSEKGCKFGKQCHHRHDWETLQDKNNRCFLCSAMGHRKSECPTKTAGPDSGKPAGGSEKGQGKGDKGKGKGKLGGKSSSTPGGSGGQSGGSPPGGDQHKGDRETPSAKAMEVEAPPAASSTSASGSTGTTEEAALMGEVTTLLKSLRASIKAVSVKKVEKGKTASILIDGGATHCLRKARDAEEFHTAEDVTVSLASGSMKMRQCTQTGTLLTDYMRYRASYR